MPQPNENIGPYTLVRQLGRGAYGAVWLAERRTALATTSVAIKLLSDDAADLAEIARESQVWAQAGGHPNVLPIIEADVYDGQVAIVSEFAPDGSLADWMARNGGHAPSLDAAIKMTAGVLDGLEHLHQRRIVHRDLKPANILLLGETPRLADFGLARVLKTGGDSASIGGTPAYMAPETFDGRRSVHSDIWAVGLILYQLLSGAYPFPRKNMAQLIGAICNREPDPLPAYVPAPLREVVDRALAKEASGRFESAAEMRAALATAAAACPAGVAVAGAVGGDAAAAVAVPYEMARRDASQTLRASASGSPLAATRSGLATESASHVPLFVTSRAAKLAERPQILAGAAAAVILAILGFYVYSILVPPTFDPAAETASASTAAPTRTAGDPRQAAPPATGGELAASTDVPSPVGLGPAVTDPGSLTGSLPGTSTPASSSPLPTGEAPSGAYPARPSAAPTAPPAPAGGSDTYAGTWRYTSGGCTGTYEIGAVGLQVTSLSGFTDCGGGGGSWTAYDIHQEGEWVKYRTTWQGSPMECKIYFSSTSSGRKEYRVLGPKPSGGGGELTRVR